MQKKRWFSCLLVIMMCIFMMTGCQNVQDAALQNGGQNNSSIQQESSFQSDIASKGDTEDTSEQSNKKPSLSNDDKSEENDDQSVSKDEQSEETSNSSKEDIESESTVHVTGNGMKVHFIDVGQGDSILVETDSHTLLIDAGENNQGTYVVNYLKSQGIDTLDYVIGTHPHSDHIGGLDVVIQQLDVSKVILPAVEHSTKTYEDVLLAIANKGLKITKPVVGTEYKLGEATFTIIAPNSAEYSDLNDYSVSIRLVYGDTSFVFTGDADTVSETEMVNNGLDLSADVLKLGHHGSAYSNNSFFLNAVNPTYAVISVGEGNSYGHPHREVLEDMQSRDVEVYRTDLQGTITIFSDGTDLTFETQRTSNQSLDSQINSANDSAMSSNDDAQSSVSTSKKEETVDESTKTENSSDTTSSETVYITESGTKYHRKGCSYLKSSIEISLEKAKSQGYSPCSRCY